MKWAELLGIPFPLHACPVVLRRGRRWDRAWHLWGQGEGQSVAAGVKPRPPWRQSGGPPPSPLAGGPGMGTWVRAGSRLEPRSLPTHAGPSRPPRACSDLSRTSETELQGARPTQGGAAGSHGPGDPACTPPMPAQLRHFPLSCGNLDKSLVF